MAEKDISDVSKSDPESHNWIYLGSNVVKERNDGVKKIRIPDGVFEKGIIDHPDENPGDDVHWAYEIGSGMLILSRKKLKGEPVRGTSVTETRVYADGGETETKYRSQGNTTQYGKQNSYSATIPKLFFDDYKGNPDRTEATNQQVPEHARVKVGKELQFLTRERFLGSDKKPCFLMTPTEMMNIIGSYRDLEEAVVPVPNFISE